MKKTFNVIFLVLFFAAGILAGGGIAHAKCHHEHEHHEHEKHGMAKLLKKLAVTSLQLKKIKSLKKGEKKAFKTAAGHKSPLFDAIKSGNFEKKVFVSDVMNNVKKHAEIKASFLENFFRILTPQQRQKFINIMKHKIKEKLEHLKFKEKIIENKIKIMQSNLK